MMSFNLTRLQTECVDFTYDVVINIMLRSGFRTLSCSYLTSRASKPGMWPICLTLLNFLLSLRLPLSTNLFRTSKATYCVEVHKATVSFQKQT